MITITRKEEVVKISAHVAVGNGWSVPFTHNNGNEFNAILLQEKLQNDLGNWMQEIRRNAYEQGWKDKASRKTPKRDWFSRSTNPDFL